MTNIYHPIVKLVWYTPEPRKVVAIAARMTRSAMDVNELTENITEEEIGKSISAVMSKHHLSVLRHVTYCFTVSGVSRAFSHQLVRHTAGHAYEQRSQHYRTENNPNMIVPSSIRTAHSLTGIVYENSLLHSEDAYYNLMEGDIPKEDARMVLPNATETQLIWTANLEALLNFIQTRACRVNNSEIMDVAVMVRKIIIETFPEMKMHLGPTCWTRGVCYEGGKFYKECNKPWKSPIVLWREDFPAKIELVGVGGLKQMIETEPKFSMKYSPNPEAK